VRPARPQVSTSPGCLPAGRRLGSAALSFMFLPGAIREPQDQSRHFDLWDTIVHDDSDEPKRKAKGLRTKKAETATTCSGRRLIATNPSARRR